MCDEARHPVLHASLGRGVAVVQTVADNDKAEEKRDFMCAVVAGLAELEARREVSLEDANVRLCLK